MPEPTTVVDTPVVVPIYLDAFERHKNTLRAIQVDELETINVDPLYAIQATEKALPRLKQMRPRLLEIFTNFDEASLDNLLDYSHTYAHTTTLLRAAEPQVGGFDALVSECGDMLGKLQAYLRAAIEADLISTSRLSELKGGVGYRNTVHDLLLVAQIYRANWAKIEGKTFLSLADIRRADELAARLNSGIAERDSKPSGFDDVSLDRQKAFTLFYRAYMRVRRAVEYLLKEQGQIHLLEEVMPSLHTNRTARKRGRDEAEGETLPTDPAAASVAAPVSAPVTSTRAKVGTPDSDPFTS